MEQRLLKIGLPGLPGAGPAGFTLVEALISMGIALTVMLAVLALSTTALRIFDGNEDLTVATNLASGKLADFKQLRIDEIQSGTDCVDWVGAPIPCDANPADGLMDSGAFQRSCVDDAGSATACDGDSDDRLDLVDPSEIEGCLYLAQQYCVTRDRDRVSCDEDNDGVLDGGVFQQRWKTSWPDLDGDAGCEELREKLAKIDLDVIWNQGGGDSTKYRNQGGSLNKVSMSTLTTGKQQ